jgi:signal transduction histidine kinase/CheY-like chemotaxis protein/streptogramin lyase
VIASKGIAVWLALATMASAAERYVFDGYGVEQGLGNLVVTALRQDRQGYLWVGTENGLYRFDGHRFRRYSTADGLPGDIVTGLAEGPDESLWVGTNKGLAWREGLRFRAGREDQLGNVAFTQGVAFDSAGHVYLAGTKGLQRGPLPKPGEDLKLQMLPQAPGVKSPRVSAVWIEPGGAIWYGCFMSVCRMENGVTQVWGESAGVPVDQWQYVIKDGAGNLWARSRVVLIELPAGESRFRIIDTADVAPVSYGYPTLAFDGRGILLAPSNTGLAMLTPSGWKHVGQRQGLPGTTVTSALADKEGSLWVGGTAGLARWTGYPDWHSYTELEGMAGGGNLALLEEAPGSIWAGSGGGLSHGVLKDGEWTWKVAGDRKTTWVSNLARAKDGAIWLTTTESQVVRLDPRTGAAQRYGKFDGQPYTIYIDSADNLWVVRTNALYRGSAAHPAAGFEQVRPPGTTPKTVFMRVTEDTRGDLWVGTFSGLFRLSNGVWSHLGTENGLAKDRVMNVTAMRNGDLYVTYRNEREIDYVHREGDRLQVTHVDRPRELSNDNVYSVREDLEGRLWALTDHGAAAGMNGSWAHFDQSDGLMWNDCNSFLAAGDGSVWIGTERGVTRIPPGQTKPGVPPKVKFSEVRLGDRDVDHAGTMIAPQLEPVSVKFTTLDLSHWRRVRYRYRCFGLDNTWIDTPRPEVSFDYLRPGKYRLQVAAAEDGLPWSSAPAELAFEVLPRWYESRWFQSLVVTMLCGALWAFWKARVRHFAAQRARLQHQVDLRTSELSAANDQLRSEIAERERAAAEKQRLEEELLQARKLESIGRLAGGVAHDFNNLLTVINGHCELLLDRLHEWDPIRSSVEEVRGAGQRAADLTQRLLAFSRKQMLQPKPISLADTVKGIESMLRRLVRENIDLLVNPRPDAGLVMADRGQFEQALVNLVVNASDAIEGSGRIVVGVRPVDIGEDSVVADPDLIPGSYVLLTVSDTGCGMDPETLRNIFEPFFTTKEVGKGTGLGLAMVHGFVKQSGGSVVAESSPGKGTTFYIYLPRVDGGPAGAGIVSAPGFRQQSRGHESILLVEDQEQVRELAVTVLQHAGYKVDNAADGESALMLVEKREAPLDLLLTDVVMPLMSGPELATKVRHRSPSTRVLFISGYSPESLNVEAPHLLKPFTPTQLLEQVRKALDA